MKHHNKPKTIAAAIAASAREEEIHLHGKLISMESFKSKSKKAYVRTKAISDARIRIQEEV